MTLKARGFGRSWESLGYASLLGLGGLAAS
jgi:hypothetical protein